MARDLWNVCLAYGNVIDVYIPIKKSKAGIVSNSFAAVLKSGSVNHNTVIESSPTIVLDDACFTERDFSCSLMRKMKDINALYNLFIILANEGFENVKLFYLGGQWVLLELDSITSKEKITNHVGVGSWLRGSFTGFVLRSRKHDGDEEGHFLQMWNIRGNNENDRGGILCVWDPRLFVKDNSTVSDSFLAISGSYRKKDVMGLYSSFDRFLGWRMCPLRTGLIDLPLEGYSFTWAHKSASKISKLDRFLICEGLLALFPSILAFEAKIVKEFHPISLIGSMYKIITKVLANRLSLVISELVSDVQSAFVFNRHILDGPFILNELLSWCKHKKSKALIFKIDFEKAFDSVRWDYLEVVLANFGFGLKWRSWIQGCLNSAMGSILVNGSPTSEFKFSKGLKQGDPLSPFLFILIMESLHLSFNNLVNVGLYNGIQINESLNLSHLFYADDVIFVGKWNSSNLSTIVNVLKWFYLASGLKINLNKSKLMGIGISHDVVASAAKSIGCSILHTPFNYPGVKVGGIMSRLSS
ncbi:RNA-directed DNA polymerase, eukaryota [Tanacetum coccineum]